MIFIALISTGGASSEKSGNRQENILNFQEWKQAAFAACFFL